VASDGSLHEIVRARTSDDPTSPSAVFYVKFDPDGTFHSRSAFEKEFIPSVLLPLPNGDFFAAGTTMEQKDDDIQEHPLAGIFSPEAKLKSTLQKAQLKSESGSSAKQEPPPSDDPPIQGGAAQLGSDGNIYVLTDGNETKVKVISPSGQVRRELKLRDPFGVGIATGMWVSGGEILVTYEGEADDPKDTHIYAKYDALTGRPVRLYRPEFSGAPACFDDGQTLTLLMPRKASAGVDLAEAQLH
jgi:hypothetical protein